MCLPLDHSRICLPLDHSRISVVDVSVVDVSVVDISGVVDILGLDLFVQRQKLALPIDEATGRLKSPREEEVDDEEGLDGMDKGDRRRISSLRTAILQPKSDVPTCKTHREYSNSEGHFVCDKHRISTGTPQSDKLKRSLYHSQASHGLKNGEDEPEQQHVKACDTIEANRPKRWRRLVGVMVHLGGKQTDQNQTKNQLKHAVDNGSSIADMLLANQSKSIPN